MRKKSISLRLPLSYAAVALLAALVLGAVLLSILYSYYKSQERIFLRSNAEAISITLTHLLQGEPQPEIIQNQLQSFAFLLEARARLLSPDREIIAESDFYPEVYLRIIPADQKTNEDGFTVRYLGESENTLNLVTPEYMVVVARGWSSLNGESVIIKSSEENPTDDQLILLDVDVVNSEVETNAAVLPAVVVERSKVVVEVPVLGEDEELLGWLELSEGPAYGREIVRSVAWGWLFAAMAAVGIAALAGWRISRTMTGPLLSLTALTQRMAEGELNVRAEKNREDELGVLADSFNHMAGRVEETVTVLRRFVADAAHELHTPLTALKTNLDLIAGSGSELEREEYIKRADDQLSRLDHLTHALIMLNQLESGAFKEDSGIISLPAWLTRMAEQYASRAEQKGITFIVNSPAESFSISGQAGKLERALENLLDNAVKFSEPGDTIMVDLKRESDWCRITIRDTGIGIAEDDLPHLFSRFFRGANASAFPGSGLGLATTRAIVDAHSGSIDVESSKEGTTFTVSLPCFLGAGEIL
ncbi:MAG: HAMP domain-containing histidine kinase [Anaerolineales bacterium]|nr:HAMP domain-containing histidine kinase [Anaerolineales bacterium]